MTKKAGLMSMRGSLYRCLSHCALVGFLSLTAPHPAHAQYVVTDVLADINSNTQVFLAALHDAVDAAGKTLLGQLQLHATDSINANARVGTEAEAATESAERNYRDPSHSACHLSQGAAMARNNAAATGAMATAMAQSQQSKPTTPAANAQDISDECVFNFAPVINTDPQTASYKALGCKSTGKWAHADSTIESLLSATQLLVPDTLTTLPNGTYQSLTQMFNTTTPPSDQYMPFVVATKFCRNITTPMSPPPMPDSSGKATASFPVIGYQTNAQSMASVAPGACYKALMYRAQFDSGTKVPAAPNTHGFVTRHDEQYAQCAEDNAAGLIDDSELADCKINGRSALQADQDKAFRRGSAKWHTQVLTKVSADMEQNLLDRAESDEVHFDEKLQQERANLTAAIAAAHNITSPNPSPLSNMTVSP